MKGLAAAWPGGSNGDAAKTDCDSFALSFHPCETAAAAIATLVFPAPAVADCSYGCRLAATNTQSGSVKRGTHVYCPGNSPFKYCKPPAQNVPIAPKPAKSKQHGGTVGILA
jgi:hypothetical protein